MFRADFGAWTIFNARRLRTKLQPHILPLLDPVFLRPSRAPHGKL
jgi:hypothetical protein